MDWNIQAQDLRCLGMETKEKASETLQAHKHQGSDLHATHQNTFRNSKVYSTTHLAPFPHRSPFSDHDQGT